MFALGNVVAHPAELGIGLAMSPLAPLVASCFFDEIMNQVKACSFLLLSSSLVVDDEQIRLVFERVNDSKFEN